MKEWQQPNTTRTYLHPPKSERMVPLGLYWTLTDTHNIIGLLRLAEAAEAYGDPRAAEIRAEYADYRKVLQGCFDRAKALAGEKAPIVITNYVPGTGGDETTHPFAPHDAIVAAALDSIHKYSMTPEYQMVERYHPRDPWFVPWSPNASANGRLLLLLQTRKERGTPHGYHWL